MRKSLILVILAAVSCGLSGCAVVSATGSVISATGAAVSNTAEAAGSAIDRATSDD